MVSDTKNDFLVFKEESPLLTIPVSLGRRWKVLIVDDEVEVHTITTLVLKDYTFENRGIEFLHAHNSIEAKEIIQRNKYIGVILLDVVMEDDTAGLSLVHWIREVQRDKLVRIILRTGQPGAAPEKQVITKYDINDYKEKTELTDTKLWTTITVALRGFRDLSIINRSRLGLEKIVQASILFSERQSLVKFFEGVLTQLTSLLDADEDSILARAEGLAIHGSPGELRIVSATGSYNSYVGRRIDDLEDKQLVSLVNQSFNNKESRFIDDLYIGYMRSDDGASNVIVFRAPHSLTLEDQDIIKVFANNVGIALLNMSLSNTIEESQTELIFTLGEVVESRSIETGYHVRRVSSVTALLALSMGMTNQEAEILKLSVPLHDIGKIGISDAILSKPDALDEAELLEMRKHTIIGYNLLRGGAHKALQVAATIALTHHERWDGKGYPQGLEADNIPLVGRITCVADVFDALLHNRVYKPAWPVEMVVNYIQDNAGTQFDPKVVEAFKEKLPEILEIHGVLNDPE